MQSHTETGTDSLKEERENEIYLRAYMHVYNLPFQIVFFFLFASSLILPFFLLLFVSVYVFDLLLLFPFPLTCSLSSFCRSPTPPPHTQLFSQHFFASFHTEYNDVIPSSHLYLSTCGSLEGFRSSIISLRSTGV